MKRIISVVTVLAILSFVSISFGQDAQSASPKVVDKLATLDGKTYTNAKVLSTDGNKALISHANGTTWIQLDNLSDKMQAALGLPNREHAAGMAKLQASKKAFAARTVEGSKKARVKYGVPEGVDGSVLSGLRWLKSVQEADGSWSSVKGKGAKESPSVHQAVTGLALLAFLGHGCTDKEPQEFAGTVSKALDYLTSSQAPDGSFGWQGNKDVISQMFAHGVCTLAMCEAYGITDNPKLKPVAEKALQFTFAKQNENGGFGYNGPADLRTKAGKLYNTTDMSVSSFQFQSMVAAKAAGITMPPEVNTKVEEYLKSVVNPDSSTSYRPGKTAGSFSMTAASLAVRLLWWGQSGKAPSADGQAKYLTNGKAMTEIANGERSGKSQASHTYDVYTIYYTSLAMFHMGGDYWKEWMNTYSGPLVSKQSSDGSWPTAGTTWGNRGGEVFTTSLGVLSLEAYCRYAKE